MLERSAGTSESWHPFLGWIWNRVKLASRWIFCKVRQLTQIWGKCPDLISIPPVRLKKKIMQTRRSHTWETTRRSGMPYCPTQKPTTSHCPAHTQAHNENKLWPIVIAQHSGAAAAERNRQLQEFGSTIQGMTQSHGFRCLVIPSFRSLASMEYFPFRTPAWENASHPL